MKQIIKYNLSNSDEILELEITTHKDFEQCISLVKSPFNNSKTFIDPELQIEQYETVVIKCYISESERLKVLNTFGENSMNISYKVVDEFISENWRNGEKLMELEGLNCSNFEHQTKYAIIK